MPQPPAYTRTKDFTENFGSETDHTSVNAELDKASTSINAIRTNIALMQADDGKILQSAITTDSLSVTVKDFLINEVSNGITTYRDQAATSAGNAATSATQAATSATNAASSASSASGSAAAAQASADSVQTYISHVADTANPHNVTKAQVGLSNVDNTSDLDKPVSTATQTALDGKVNTTGAETIAGVKTFASSPLLPTPASSDDSTKGATTAYVRDVAFGVDQTIQNLTASRALSTTYTNSTGKMILVTVTCTTAATCTLTATVDGVAYGNISNVTGHAIALTFPVPNGSTYSAALNAAGSLLSWRELR